MDLGRLIAGMTPVLDDGVYVFALTDTPDGLPALMRFEESEGTTLIMRREDAEAAQVRHEFSCRRITLQVHSALEAVGFIARIATVLASEGMGVNPVAGFHHDHLFVPEDRAEDAMRILTQLARDG